MSTTITQNLPRWAGIIAVTVGLWTLILVAAPYSMSGQSTRHLFARAGLALSVLIATLVQAGIYLHSGPPNAFTSRFLETIWLVQALIGLLIVFWSAYQVRSRISK